MVFKAGLAVAAALGAMLIERSSDFGRVDIFGDDFLPKPPPPPGDYKRREPPMPHDYYTAFREQPKPLTKRQKRRLRGKSRAPV